MSSRASPIPAQTTAVLPQEAGQPAIIQPATPPTTSFWTTRKICWIVGGFLGGAAGAAVILGLGITNPLFLVAFAVGGVALGVLAGEMTYSATTPSRDNRFEKNNAPFLKGYPLKNFRIKLDSPDYSLFTEHRATLTQAQTSLRTLESLEVPPALLDGTHTHPALVDTHVERLQRSFVKPINNNLQKGYCHGITLRLIELSRLHPNLSAKELYQLVDADHVTFYQTIEDTLSGFIYFEQLLRALKTSVDALQRDGGHLSAELKAVCLGEFLQTQQLRMPSEALRFATPPTDREAADAFEDDLDRVGDELAPEVRQAVAGKIAKVRHRDAPIDTAQIQRQLELNHAAVLNQIATLQALLPQPSVEERGFNTLQDAITNLPQEGYFAVTVYPKSSKKTTVTGHTIFLDLTNNRLGDRSEGFFEYHSKEACLAALRDLFRDSYPEMDGRAFFTQYA